MKTVYRNFSVFFLICLPFFFCSKPKVNPYQVPNPNMPADNISNPARIELGKALYFDPRLSSSNWISCASCHNPALGWGDGLATGIGHNFQTLGRNSPTIINSAFSGLQFWDGRAETLEEQAAGPIASPGEMNQDIDALIEKLSAINGYKELFDKAYPEEGIKKSSITKAIASFERTVISKDSPFDKWMVGDEKAVSESAKIGFGLFNGKAECAVCHAGFNFSDSGFHNIGVKSLDKKEDIGFHNKAVKSLEEKEDIGRYSLVPVRVMKGAFKTPTLRDVALTSPYMHNGIYKTLEEVVEHYDRKGDNQENLSPNLKGPLNLNTGEKKDLVEFLKTLTGKTVEVTLPVLPQ